MTTTNDETIDFDELQDYLLNYLKDIVAFQAYINRSQAARRMVNIH
ncbi:hypothetical protein NIES2098_70000 [Calothrix sp. NIES-2098]|nr:hypothetical protein NIES2098_70000 [Calothrix sp. NIES-2098]